MRSASASSWGSSARRSAVVVRNNSVQRPLDERPPTCDNTRRHNSSCRGMLWLWSDVGLSTGATPSPPPSTSKASLCGVTPDSEWLTSYLRAGREGGLTMVHDVSKGERAAGATPKAQRRPGEQRQHLQRRAKPWPVGSTPVVAGVPPAGFAPVTEEALQAMVRRLVTRLHPHKIVLFGSYSYGMLTAPGSHPGCLAPGLSCQRECGVAELCRVAPTGLCRRQSRVTTPVVDRTGRGSDQPPQVDQAEWVWTHEA